MRGCCHRVGKALAMPRLTARRKPDDGVRGIETGTPPPRLIAFCSMAWLVWV